jgi:hypothetical protein
LPTIFSRLRCEHIVVSHVTRRTPIGEAKRALEVAVGAQEMERVIFLMDRRARRPAAPPANAAHEAPTADERS